MTVEALCSSAGHPHADSRLQLVYMSSCELCRIIWSDLDDLYELLPSTAGEQHVQLKVGGSPSDTILKSYWNEEEIRSDRHLTVGYQVIQVTAIEGQRAPCCDQHIACGLI